MVVPKRKEWGESHEGMAAGRIRRLTICPMSAAGIMRPATRFVFCATVRRPGRFDQQVVKTALPSQGCHSRKRILTEEALDASVRRID